MPEYSVVVGSVGVGLLLVAFFLNLFGLLARESLIYISLNVLGGGLACYASWLIRYVPFVILEGTWAVVAGVALVRRLSAGAPARHVARSTHS